MWPFNYKYPRTEYQTKESDLSWFLEQFNELREDWATFKTGLEAEWATFKTGLEAEWATFKSNIETTVASLASIVNNFFDGQAVRLQYGGTGVSVNTKEDLINAFGLAALGDAKEVDGDTDMNDVLTPGTYIVAATTQIGLNRPSNVSFRLLVIRNPGNYTPYMQIAIVGSTIQERTRIYGSWRSWSLIQTSNRLIPVAEGGTGASTALGARVNLGLGNVLTDLQTALDRALQAFPVETKSGAIASFNSGAAGLEVKSLSFDINPIQEGVGDPSPANIRPISGRTGADVTRCGKNFLVPSGEITRSGVTAQARSDGGVYLNGTASGSATLEIMGGYKASEVPIPDWLVPGTYTFSNSGVSGVTYRLYLYSAIATGQKIFQGTFSVTQADLDENDYYGIFVRVDDETTLDTVVYPQLERGAASSAYEQYSGETYALNWQTEAGTVYGGTAEYLGGGNWRLTITMVNIASYNGESINDPWISSMDAYEAGATPTTGAQVVYTLATPLTYTLTTNELVNSLYGENNIWSSGGNTTATIRCDPTLYIAEKTQ